MRLEHGCLDGLSADQFRAEVEDRVCSASRPAPRARTRRLAECFGL